MGTIHCKDTPDGKRYRIWSSVVDAYCTEPLTKDQMTAHLLREARRAAERDVAERMERAAATGESGHRQERKLTDDWKTERCQACGSFHHAFNQSKEHKGCSVCGQPANDIGHRLPCAAVSGVTAAALRAYLARNGWSAAGHEQDSSMHQKGFNICWAPDDGVHPVERRRLIDDTISTLARTERRTPEAVLAAIQAASG